MTISDQKLKDCRNINECKNRILQQFGRFQILSLLLLSPASACIGMKTLAFVFLNIVPDYKCKDQQDNMNIRNNHSSNFALNFDQCYRNLSVLEIKNLTQSSSENVTVLTSPCISGWNYDYSMGNTVVSEFNLICGAAWKRPLILSSLFLGMLVGSSFGGFLSDRYGRKKTSVVSFAVLFIVEALMSFSPNYPCYVIFVFLLGVAGIIVYLVVFVWSCMVLVKVLPKFDEGFQEKF